MSDIQKIAQQLREAELVAREVERVTKAQPRFSLADGYSVQAALLALHTRDGAAIAGWKMGMTSKPKMQQMGVNSPIRGFLTNKMRVADGGVISLKGRIHAKIEPEIAFLMGRDLAGQPSVAEAMAAVDGVCAALEIIDSRYKNFEFELPDVVADNCSSSGFVLGSTFRRPGAIDLANLGLLLEFDGRPVQFGSSAAILGHPGRALAALAALLEEEGGKLRAGDVVLAGAATAAMALRPALWVRACVQGLGTVEASVET